MNKDRIFFIKNILFSSIIPILAEKFILIVSPTSRILPCLSLLIGYNLQSITASNNLPIDSLFDVVSEEMLQELSGLYGAVEQCIEAKKDPNSTLELDSDTLKGIYESYEKINKGEWEIEFNEQYHSFHRTLFFGAVTTKKKIWEFEFQMVIDCDKIEYCWNNICPDRKW